MNASSCPGMHTAVSYFFFCYLFLVFYHENVRDGDPDGPSSDNYNSNTSNAPESC